jgi:DNA-directed RNA polymerase specialized sigma subunit
MPQVARVRRHPGSVVTTADALPVEQKAVAQMRKQRGLTQAQVAQSMGVSQARVSRMEHGDVEWLHVESIAALRHRDRRPPALRR